jgi:hypothetical protein
LNVSSSEFSSFIKDSSPLIIQEVLRAVRSEPLLSTYHKQSDDKLLNRFQDVTENLSDWLQASDNDMLQSRYRDLAQERIQRGVPLSEVVLTAQTFERVLIGLVRSSATDNPALSAPDIEAIVREFFNRVVFSVVVTYERALFEALLS